MSLADRGLEYIRRNRDRPLVKRLASGCRQILLSYENSCHEHATNGELRVLRALAGSNLRTIFDVGACTGSWARMAREAHPAAGVHCFEIVPDTFSLLMRNLGQDPLTVLNGFGLADREGEATVKAYPRAPHLASLLDYPHGLEHVQLTCRVTTGDRYLAQHQIERIDFLKIDVEGAEMAVLRGFSEAFAAGLIRFVQFEYGFANVISHSLLKDFHAFFGSMSFLVGKVYPDRVDFRPYHPCHEDFIGPNFLAVASGEAASLASLARTG